MLNGLVGVTEVDFIAPDGCLLALYRLLCGLPFDSAEVIVCRLSAIMKFTPPYGQLLLAILFV